MITDRKLINNGFKKEKISDVIYFKKGSIIIEKIFNGYLLAKPYKKISKIEELNKLIKSM